MAIVDPKKAFKLTPEVKQKLEQAFSIDASVPEACFFAGISRQTYHNWIQSDPELKESFDRLREKPVLKARQTIAQNLDQPETAKWYLERKKKTEFSSRVETTGADGGAIDLRVNDKRIVNVVREAEEEIRKVLISGDKIEEK